METNHLRPCKVRTAKATNKFEGDKVVPIPDQVEDGLFHMWFVSAYGDEGFQQNRLHAVVELQDGKVKWFDTEDVKFTDKPMEWSPRS